MADAEPRTRAAYDWFAKLFGCPRDEAEQKVLACAFHKEYDYDDVMATVTDDQYERTREFLHGYNGRDICGLRS